MDQETEIKFDPEGNRYKYNYARAVWEPIAENYGRGATFVEGAKNAATRLGAGILQGPTNLALWSANRQGNTEYANELQAMSSALGQRVNQSDQALQQAGGRDYPITSFAGQAAPYALGGFGGLGVKATMGAEAALGGLSYGTPQERALGAGLGAVGGGAGVLAGNALQRTLAGRVREGIVDASNQTNRPLVPQINNQGLGPGGVSGSDDFKAGSALRRVAEKRLFSQVDPNIEAVARADEVGIKLTPGQRRGSNQQQVTEEALMRDPGAGGVFAREFSEPNQALITDKLRRAGGLDGGTKLGLDDFTKMSDAISEEFHDITNEIRSRYLVINDDVSKMKDITNTIQDAKARQKTQDSWVKPWVRELEGESVGADRPMSEPRLAAKDVWGIIRDLNASIGGDNLGPTQREALESLRGFWENRLENMARDSGKPDILARMKNVNEKYRIQKLVQSSGVMRGNEVNIRSLANRASQQFKDTMMRNDYTDGRGRPLERATTDLVKSLQVVKAFPNVLGNSGTPTGQIFQGGMMKGIEKMTKSQAGAEAYLGFMGKAAKGAAMVPASVAISMASGGRL